MAFRTSFIFFQFSVSYHLIMPTKVVEREKLEIHEAENCAGVLMHSTKDVQEHSCCFISLHSLGWSLLGVPTF